MSKFFKSLFIIIWFFFYPRFILVMILILTLKPVLKSLLHKYPILFLEYWLESKQYRIFYFQVSFILQTQIVYFYILTLSYPQKMKESLPFPFLKKKRRRKKESIRKTKKIPNFILLKKVICLECSTFWNTCIHNFLIYPVEGNKKRKKTTLH